MASRRWASKRRSRRDLDRRRAWVEQRERDRILDVPSQMPARPIDTDPEPDDGGTADRPPTKEAVR